MKWSAIEVTTLSFFASYLTTQKTSHSGHLDRFA